VGREPMSDAEGTATFPGALAGLGMVAALIALECAGEIHLRLLIALPEWLHDGTATANGLPMIVRSLVRLLPLLLLAGLGWRRSRAPAAEVFPLQRPSPGLLVPLAVCAVGLSVVLSEVDNLARSVATLPEGYLLTAGPTTGDWRDDAWKWLYLLLLKPLSDELLFRGVMLRGFAGRYPAAAAVGLSALFYAVVPLNPLFFPAVFARGLLLGWLYLKTRSLLPGVLLVALSAGAASALEWIAGPIPGYTSVLEGGFHPWWLNAVGSCALLAGLAGVAWALRRDQGA